MGRPDRVVVAGGAARFLDLFEPGLRRSLDRGPKYAPEPAVAAAELGDLSGAIGAAVPARPSRRAWSGGTDEFSGPEPSVRSAEPDRQE